MITARCPNNPEHKEFVTSAHVMQEWKVDEHGEHLETLNDCVQVSNGPEYGNTWYCFVCKVEAEVEL